MEEVVPETQSIVAFQKERVKDFLEKSWKNMVEMMKDDDQSINYIPEKKFQVVTSRRRNKKSKSTRKTRSKYSHPKMYL